MMKTTGLMAGASRFAHFAGLTRASTSRRAAEDDDDQKQSRRAADDDDDDGNGADDDDDGKAGKRSRRAADDDDGKGDGADGDDDDGKQGRRASDEDDDDDGKGAGDDDDDGKASKRSRRAADDDDGKDADDDEDEMKGKGAVASARRREQTRIAHILGHSAAAANPVLAVTLACETRMTRREAVRVLKSQPAREGAEEGRGNRHAREDRSRRNVTLGSDAGAPSGKQAVDASWGAAFGKAGIKTR